MKKEILIIVQCFMYSMLLHAQDAYHVKLLDILKTDYNVSASSNWVLSDNEIATISKSSSYSGTTNNITVTGQPFTQAVQRIVTIGANPWDAAHSHNNQTIINANDVCLMAAWIRSPTAAAKINMFAENNASTNYDKEFYASLNISSDWKLYLIPFQAKVAYPLGKLTAGFHLATANQTIEIGGVAVLNYQNKIILTKLPTAVGNDYYGGIEPNAPWRADAASRIEALRKADLNVKVLDNNAKGIVGAKVHIEMLQHEYKFGTAVVSSFFNGGLDQNNTYEQKMLNLDGKGHGFNEIVFENDLKWPAWEAHWFSSQAHIASDMKWLKNKGISVRGHNLLWPNWEYSPNDITNTQSVDYIKNRISKHIENILKYPDIGNECADWDVINELTENEQFATKFQGTTGYVTGRELYVETFKKAKSLAPKPRLYINDYVAIEQGDGAPTAFNKWKTRISELISSGAAVEGIGLQGHFSSTPTSITRVNELYDDLWKTYKLPTKVTEYDISNLLSQKLQAQYMRDILTISFAHPSSKGFLMWGFWDGAHWLNNSPIYAKDWTIKPSGQAFIDLVFKDWWTDVNLISATNGDTKTRAFKGKYKVTVTLPNNTTQTLIFDLSEDKTLIINNLGITISDKDVSEKLICNLYPNPVHDIATLIINTTESSEATISIIDLKGQVLQMQHADLKADMNNILLNTEAMTNGLYFVKISTNTGVRMLKMEVVR